jgi:hypothetical protein
VVIPTTQGPSIIQRITAEDPAVRSVICLNGSSKVLPISRDYDAFVKEPTGIVERAVRHGAFRIDVDRPIDEGDSWQLAVFIAHLLKGAGRLAEGDEPADRVLWATGTVDRYLNVGPVEKVKDKLDASAEYLGALTAPFLAAVPTRAKESFRDPSLLPVANADELWAQLAPDAGLTSAKLVTGARAFRKKMRRRVMGWIALAIAAVILLSEIIGYDPESAQQRREARQATVAAVTGGTPEAAEVTAPSSEMTTPEPKAPEIVPAGPVFDPTAVLVSVETGPASILVRARNDGEIAAFVLLIGRVDGAFREYAGDGAKFTKRASAMVAPGENLSLTVDGPSWVRRSLTGLAVAIVAESEPADLSALDQALSSDEMQTAARALATDAVAVTVTTENLDPLP